MPKRASVPLENVNADPTASAVPHAHAKEMQMPNAIVVTTVNVVLLAHARIRLALRLEVAPARSDVYRFFCCFHISVAPRLLYICGNLQKCAGRCKSTTSFT